MYAPWWDSEWKDRQPDESRVYVGNLPWGTDERSLKDAFADYGPLSAEIAFDHETGRSRGFGFVNFEDHESTGAGRPQPHRPQGQPPPSPLEGMNNNC